MMVYQRYITKLLFSRFFAILLCVSIFGVFQEIAKGELLKVCTFWQSMLIVFLLLPMVLFSFLPFVHFGSLFVVLDNLYSNNELISFKSIGLSHRQLMKTFLYFTLFVLGFFVFLGLLYPFSNRLFYRQRSVFLASNMLKMLQPGKINRFGNYEIVFDKIKNNKLHNVLILTNSNVAHKAETAEERVIFSKTMSFSYNEFQELVVHCIDADVLIMNNNIANNFDKKIADSNYDYNVLQKKNIEFKNKQANMNVAALQRVIHAKNIDALFDDLVQTKVETELKYKQQLRKTGLISVLNKKTFNKDQKKIKKLELHGRAVVYWFVILTITYICCMLLTNQSSRISAVKITLMVFVLSLVVALSRAFLLESLIMSRYLFLYYLCCLVVCFFCGRKIRKQDVC